MAEKLNKVDAVLALMWANDYQGGNTARRAADYRRCQRAMDVLGVTVPQDRARINDKLCFTDSHGVIYPWLADALNAKRKAGAK